MIKKAVEYKVELEDGDHSQDEQQYKYANMQEHPAVTNTRIQTITQQMDENLKRAIEVESRNNPVMLHVVERTPDSKRMDAFSRREIEHQKKMRLFCVIVLIILITLFISLLLNFFLGYLTSSN